MFHFIVSAPRSGSTWLMQALNQHPQIYATEQRLFGNFCEIWPNLDGTATPRITFDQFATANAMHMQFQPLGLNRKSFIEQFQTSYHEFLHGFYKSHFDKSRVDKSVFVDKVTPYRGTVAQVLKSIRHFFPDSKIIYLVRDGRDVVTSGAFDWLAREPRDSARYQAFIDREPNLKLERFFDDQLLETWANHWQECHLAIQQSGWTTLSLRYESMLADQAVELQRVCNLLAVDDSLEGCQQCADQVGFEKMTGRKPGSADPTAKARTGIAGNWKQWFTKMDGQLFAEHAGEALFALEYEVEGNWFQKLPQSLQFQ